MSSTSFLTFAMAGSAYAIPLRSVREIVACRSVVRVPNAGEAVRGVMNVRGSVIPVFDLARRLGLGDTNVGSGTSAVLLESDIDGEATAIAALVEQIDSVIDVQPAGLEPVPAFGSPIDVRLVDGVTQAAGRFAWLLNLDAVLGGLT